MFPYIGKETTMNHKSMNLQGYQTTAVMNQKYTIYYYSTTDALHLVMESTLLHVFVPWKIWHRIVQT